MSSDRRSDRSGDPRADPRLRRAYELLRSLFEGPAADAAPGPWQISAETLADDPWLVSATDLLVPWSPEVLAGAAVRPAGPELWPELWDAYFAPATDARPPSPPEPEGSEAAEPAPLRPPVPAGRISLEEPLDDAAAFAATECLYALVHGIGRLDVDAAMAVVADDYHAIEADREVDAGALRHRLEELVDGLRGGEVDVSLAEVPEPIPYRDGLVLIPATLQIDRRPDGDPAAGRSLVLEWIAVLEETAAGFRICALAPRRERPSDPLPAAGGA